MQIDINVIKKGLWVYITQLLIAAAILYFIGLYAFLIYSLALIIIKIDVALDWVRKRVDAGNDEIVTILTVIENKLKIDTSEVVKMQKMRHGNYVPRPVLSSWKKDIADIDSDDLKRWKLFETKTGSIK